MVSRPGLLSSCIKKAINLPVEYAGATVALMIHLNAAGNLQSVGLGGSSGPWATESQAKRFLATCKVNPAITKSSKSG